MKIAVEGCAHGELENIYDTIKLLEERENIKVDLLICCGDFQSSRNEADLRCMAIPPKYYNICSFYKYYNGEKKAPILTIFIGGNHEASNYLQELPYGGWVAPNIYYMGNAGVINIAGIRIGGLSGIYKSHDYTKGRYEKAPYDESTKRSVYHIRNLDVFRLKQLSGTLDIFLSHDWPTGICNYGDKEHLLKIKPFFREDIENGDLGSSPCEELLYDLKPNYWFSAHLHCKFAALVPHENRKSTKFLALDKCLPKRMFLQILDLPHEESQPVQIQYDLEWLTIVYLTNHLLSVKSVANYMPGPNGNERYLFTPTDEEKSFVLKRLENNLIVPENFAKTAVGYEEDSTREVNVKQPEAKLNPQTVLLCEQLSISDPVSLLHEMLGINFVTDDSFLVKTSQSRTSLVLPEPKLDVSVEDDEDILEENRLNTKKLEEQLLVDDEEVEENLSSKGDDTITDCSVLDESPTPKKFKRRNANLYNSCEES